MTQVSTRCTFPRCHWVCRGTEAEGEAEFSTHRRLAHLLAGQYAYSTVTAIPRVPEPRAARALRMTDEQILTVIRAEALEFGTPTIKAWQLSGRKPSSRAIIERFGSWNGAMRSAGLEPRGRGRPPSDALPKVTPPPGPVARDRA